jgi:hypothetical protein
MAFSSKSNGCIQSSIKWRVYIEKWANKSYTLQMMTKDMAFMYNLSPTTGSNDILGNQLMQKSFWLVASNIQYQGNLIVGNSGGTFKEWGYQRSTTGTFCMEVLPYLELHHLKMVT